MSYPDPKIRQLAREHAEKIERSKVTESGSWETVLFVLGAIFAALVWLVTVAIWPAALVACAWLLARAWA